MRNNYEVIYTFIN